MFAGLIVAYYHARLQEELLLAIPRVSGTSLPLQLIEDAGNRGLILTFENRQVEMISVLGNSHSVVLIGTNHSFPFVMNYSVSHGRFFREDAVRYGHRVAVLNKSASFALFGTVEATGNELMINNMPHVIAGVIDDGDSSGLNIYIPAPLLGDTTETIAANLSLSPTLTDIGILNEWQHMGIEGQRYKFVDFSVLQTVIRDKIALALALIMVTVIVFLLQKTLGGARNQVLALRQLIQDEYITAVITKPPIWKLLGLCVALACMVLGIIAIIMNSFMRGLVAYDARGMLANVQSAAFSRQIADMTRWYNLSNLFFLGFIVFFAMIIIERSHRKNMQLEI